MQLGSHLVNNDAACQNFGVTNTMATLCRPVSALKERPTQRCGTCTSHNIFSTLCLGCAPNIGRDERDGNAL